MTRPHEFTSKIKAQAFELHHGKCAHCGCKVLGRAEYHHGIPLALGGASSLENCVVLCSKCHRIHTSTIDVPAISKVKRIRAKSTGTKRPTSRPIAGSKASPWKHKLNGQVERRS